MYQHYKRFKIGRYYFSNVEFKDLAKSLFGISLAFSVAFTAGRVWTLEFVFAFIVSIVVVGIGFLFHELAHKFVAQRYGCQAEFRSFDKMLIIAVLIAFSGFIFIAPGAVMIGGKRVSKKQNGVISMAGPMTNIVIALVFMALSLLVVVEFLPLIFEYGFILNSLLAAFNMIPIGNFDGRKVFRWNKLVWFGMMAFAAVLFVLSYSNFV